MQMVDQFWMQINNVSNTLHQGVRTDHDQFRVPALELEKAVIDACIAWLEDESHLLDFANVDSAASSPAQVLAQALAQAQERTRHLTEPHTQYEALHHLVQRITIYPNRLEMQVADNPKLTATITVSYKR